ncbi:MAG: MBL fold metallo-hydrolase [Candidatus Woesearchaeota archaeon]
MELIFHGAAQEVGRSCIELKLSNDDRYLFDVGIKFKENGLQLPENVEKIHEVAGVFLSHAHLDHSGGLPLFEHKDLQGPIFCTRQTIAISRLMLNDSFKVARIRHVHAAYNKTDLENVMKDVRKVSFDRWYKHKDIKFKFYNAGHIPGSAMILVEAEGKKILYTGDINTQKTQLMFKAQPHPELKGKIDVLISESTNGHRIIPNREELNKKFLESVQETLDKKGKVIIPVFSVGRAQEILILLGQKEWDVPIYSDGLANKVTRQILANKSKYIDNKETLRKMFYETIHWIGSEKKRKDAMKKQGIFITTSGMLQGGPILSYIKEMWHDENSKIMLVGFQCKNTNGRHLIDEGYLYLDGWKTYVKCEVEKYDFSGHADAEGLKEIITSIQPKKLVFQHGDPESVGAMYSWAIKNTKSKVYKPEINDLIKL